MKKSYKVLLCIIILEFVILSTLDPNEVAVQSWIGKAIGTLICLLPIQTLLFLLSKDNKLAKGKKLIFKILFIFINICYVLGGITTFIEHFVI